MSTIAQYRFELSDPEVLDEFIREYVLSAQNRVRDYESTERFSFAPGGTETRSSVLLSIQGDPASVIEREKSHFEPYLEEGVIEEWEQLQEFDVEAFESMLGPDAAALNQQLTELSAELAAAVYDELDSFPAAVDTYPDEGEGMPPVGWWAILHTLTVQANYDLDEELAAYRYGIEHTLRNFGEYYGEDAVDERVDELKEAVEAMREQAKEGRLGP